MESNDESHPAKLRGLAAFTGSLVGVGQLWNVLILE